MRTVAILLLSAFFPILSFSQSKKDIMGELRKTQEKLESLQRIIEVNKAQLDERIYSLEKEIAILRTGNSTNLRSQKIQENIVGGSYSDSTHLDNFQNRTNLEPASTSAQKKQLGPGDGLTPSTGAKIYTGPRGGQYYINKNGNKTYIKKKK